MNNKAKLDNKNFDFMYLISLDILSENKNNKYFSYY